MTVVAYDVVHHVTHSKLIPMTEEQLNVLRSLIQLEIEVAQIDGMEHGAWGWAEKQLDQGWQDLKDSFKST
jgi:hypothetical protein